MSRNESEKEKSSNTRFARFRFHRLIYAHILNLSGDQLSAILWVRDRAVTRKISIKLIYLKDAI